MENNFSTILTNNHSDNDSEKFVSYDSDSNYLESDDDIIPNFFRLNSNMLMSVKQFNSFSKFIHLENDNPFYNFIDFDNLSDHQKDLFYINYYFNNKNYYRIEIKRKQYMFSNYIFEILNTEKNIGFFGGLIRDINLHDYGASKFYQEYSKYKNKKHNSINIDSFNLSIQLKSQYLYSNYLFDTESFYDRILIFNDIDCIMYSSTFENIINKLTNKNNDFLKNIEITIRKIDINQEYLNINNPEEVITDYYKIILESAITRNGKISLMIDAFICKEKYSILNLLKNITKKSDFYCNSLFLYQNEIGIDDSIVNKILPEEKNNDNNPKNKLNNFFNFNLRKKASIDIILEQIYQKKAILIDKYAMKKRFVKMQDKKFTFHDNLEKKFLDFSLLENNKNEDICIICTYEIDKKEKYIKLKCCNTNFHTKCFKTSFNNTNNLKKFKNCFTCKKSIKYSSILNITRCLIKD